MDFDALDEAVITMHNIARLIEKELGLGKLSQDTRELADRLNKVLAMESKYGKKPH
jgi:hypothetical protein